MKSRFENEIGDEASRAHVDWLAAQKPAVSPWDGVSPACRRASTALAALANLRLNIAAGPRKAGWVAELRAARLKAVSTLAEVARLAVLAESLLPASVVRLGEVVAEGAEDRDAATALRSFADHLDGVGGVDEHTTEPGLAPVIEAGDDEEDVEAGDGPLSRRDGGHRPAIECAVYRP